MINYIILFDVSLRNIVLKVIRFRKVKSSGAHFIIIFQIRYNIITIVIRPKTLESVNMVFVFGMSRSIEIAK